MRIGPYEVVSELGRGGMGVVYLGRSPSGEERAIKVLLRARSGEALARFDRERRLLAALGESDGFVPLLDAGQAGAVPYFVMPFVKGGTLRARLAKGPLAVETTIALGRELARAVGRAHALGVVHRDLKPENVLFTAGGRALVADLGLAKHFREDVPGASRSASLSGQGETRGTVGYMPREQIRDAKAVGPAADVFALGAILHECLAGRPAFFGETIVEVVRNVEAGRVEALPRSVPRWLAAIVERALALRAEDRFPDAVALARALERGAPAAWRARLLAGVVLLLVAAAAALLIERRAGPPPPSANPAADAAKDAQARRRALAEEWIARGVDKYEKGDFDGAIADSTKAIELEPRVAKAWANRGGAFGRKGDHVHALADLSKAIELDPKLAYAYLNRGASRQSRGDAEGAIADLTRALEIDPTDAFAWANRGAALLERGDAKRAIDDLTKAVERDPRLAEAWMNRGVAWSRTGDPAAAASDFRRFLELAPDDPKAANVRSWLETNRPPPRKGAPPQLRFDAATRALAASSDVGLVAVVTSSPKRSATRRFTEQPPTRAIRLSHADLRTLARAGTDEPIVVELVDAAGQRAVWRDAGLTAGLDAELGDGWGPFRFGASPEAVATRLPLDKAAVTEWSSLPAASEFKTAEVRYLWANLADLMKEVPEARFQGAISASSYACFLFRDRQLIRISLRFENGEDQRDHRFVLDSFLGARNARAVASGRDDRCVFAGEKSVVCARADEKGVRIEIARAGEPAPADQDW